MNLEISGESCDFASLIMDAKFTSPGESPEQLIDLNLFRWGVEFDLIKVSRWMGGGGPLLLSLRLWLCVTDLICFWGVQSVCDILIRTLVGSYFD